MKSIIERIDKIIGKEQQKLDEVTKANFSRQINKFTINDEYMALWNKIDDLETLAIQLKNENADLKAPAKKLLDAVKNAKSALSVFEERVKSVNQVLWEVRYREM